MGNLPATIRIGARGSELSRWQANHVAGLLRSAYPSLTVHIVPIETKGDRLLDTPLPLLGGKGAFTAELEAALLHEHIDLAVHSLKDLPTKQSPGLTIGAVTRRDSVVDALVSRAGCTLATLPPAAVVGTSSLRRSAQLLRARSDLKPTSIRGNVGTRLRKVFDPDTGYDAIVLARAGLERLGRLDVITEELSLDIMLPAPGQGALAVQCRDDPVMIAFLQPVHHNTTALATAAERSFLAALGAGCSAPVAALAWIARRELWLHGRILAQDGSNYVDIHLRASVPDVMAAEALGRRAAERALARGADSLLKAAR